MNIECLCTYIKKSDGRNLYTRFLQLGTGEKEIKGKKDIITSENLSIMAIWDMLIRN